MEGSLWLERGFCSKNQGGSCGHSIHLLVYIGINDGMKKKKKKKARQKLLLWLLRIRAWSYGTYVQYDVLSSP